jgi:hypothetical protein
MAFGELKLEVAAVESTWLAAEAPDEGEGEISLDGGVAGGPADHGDRAGSVEFVAELLSFLPGEELGERHGLGNGKVHGGDCSTVPHWRVLDLSGDV